MTSDVRRKVTVKCPNCRLNFRTILRWEGLPENDYCTPKCESEHDSYEGLYKDDIDDFDYTRFRGDY